MGLSSVLNEIKKGNTAGIYLFYGEESFKKRYCRDILTRAVTNGSMMNCSAFEGKDINWQEVYDLSQTLPFFSAKRLLIIENSGRFKAGKTSDGDQPDDEGGARAGKDAGDMIVKIMTDLPETTCLAFFEESAAKNKKIFRLAASKGVVCECGRDNEDTIINWLAKGFNGAGKKIRKSTLELMVSRIGLEYDKLRPEFEKVISFAGDREVIEDRDILEITSENTESRIFDMLTAICRKDVRTVLDKYYDLLANKEHPLYIMAMIRSQFRTMLQIKEMWEKHMSVAEISGTIGKPAFAVSRTVRNLDFFSRDQLLDILDEISETDRKCKSGEIKDQLGVELMLIKFSC